MKGLLSSIGLAFVLATLAPGCGGSSAESGDEQNQTAAAGRFETFVSDDGQHHFQLLAGNGEKIRSEGYTSLSGAKKGIASVRTNGQTAARYKVLTAANGESYFNLVAANGKIIGTSEAYASKSNATRGVNTVMNVLKTAVDASAAIGSANFETFVGQDGKSYFHLRAKNGEIVLQSQGYSSKSGATKGIVTVKSNGADASNFDVVEAQNGQYYFRLLAQNMQVIGYGELYASKSGALHGADAVRDMIRDLGGAGQVTDTEIKAEIERAAEGLLYMSEGDYPFGYVQAALSSSQTEITEKLVRDTLASYVDSDEDADKPMAELVAMQASWDEWKGLDANCGEEDEECFKMRNLEQVLESNLKDIQVFYFGSNGEPGYVEGIGVSIFIVGRTPSGTLAGVRTLAIWT